MKYELRGQLGAPAAADMIRPLLALLAAAVTIPLFVMQQFTILGTFIIVCGIVAALLATISYTLVTRGNSAALAYGRLGTRAALGAVLLLVVLLAFLFIAERYDIKYVYDYSSRDLEFFFRVAAMWAGQPGSFVVWALWGLIAAQLLIGRTRHAEPYVLSVFMLIQAALLIFMLFRNPFIPFTDANGIRHDARRRQGAERAAA